LSTLNEAADQLQPRRKEFRPVRSAASMGRLFIRPVHGLAAGLIDNRPGYLNIFVYPHILP